MTETEDLRGRILEYLQTRKLAAETPEGINRVWLRRPSLPEMIAEVEIVLEEMAKEGLLVKQVLPGPVSIFYPPDGGNR